MLTRLARLRRMSRAELNDRLRQAVRRGSERARAALHLPSRLEVFERNVARCVSFKGYLEQAAERFYLPSGDRARSELRALFEQRMPERVEASLGEAEALRHHRVPLLGFGEVVLGTEIDWHRDPVTGQRWPRRFWTRYDLVHDWTAGDAKRVLELNRHQHLVRLGKAYFLGGEEADAAEVVDQLLGWIEQNPVGFGVHWHSSLEIAVRSIAWMWALFFILPSPALDEAAARTIGASLFAQLEHVRRHPSLFSSPNTHLLGEAAALFIAGLLFADLPLGRAWRNAGSRWLHQGFSQQVNAEGAHSELSPSYHCYALDFGLQALALAERSGGETDLCLLLRVRLAAMVAFLASICRADGTLPSLGDDDGGRALALAATDYHAPLDLLATGGRLLPDAPHPVGAAEPQEETLWILGRDIGDAWNTAAAAPVPGRPLRVSYPASGYFVQRGGARPEDGQLGFDCGSLGGARGGHGHADALAVTLCAGGRELLVDPGTFVYNAAPGWRDYFRSTRAHNTVVVDGRDQSIPGDTFSWQRTASARLLADLDFGAIAYLAGEHDGYARGPSPVVHRRRILHVRPDSWLLCDEICGLGRHTYEIHYHFAPECTVSVVERYPDGGGCVRAESPPAGLWVVLAASLPLELELVCGRSVPPLGWVSRRYGAKCPATVLRGRCQGDAPVTIVSLLRTDHSSSASISPFASEEQDNVRHRWSA